MWLPLSCGDATTVAGVNTAAGNVVCVLTAALGAH